jgi:hypothetical protein
MNISVTLIYKSFVNSNIVGTVVLIDIIFVHSFCISSACVAPIGSIAFVSRPALQWVPGVLSLGVKRGRGVTLTTHPHLVPRSWMNRSCIFSPPCASIVVLWDSFFYHTVDQWQNIPGMLDRCVNEKEHYNLAYISFLKKLNLCDHRVVFPLNLRHK